MRRFLLVFISFLPLSIFAQLRVHYYAQLNAFPKVSELYPISLYAHVIKEELFPPRNDLYSLYAKTIITPNISALTGLEADGEDAIVHIIVVDDAGRATSKGGWAVKNNGSKVRFVLYNQNSSAQELLHELGHALFELGDEYGNELFMPAHCRVDFHRNISFSPYHEDWERIGKIVQKKPQYKSGGLGYAKGVYHGFEACLMRSLDEEFCPICLYYIISDLNAITGLDVVFPLMEP